MTPPAYLTEAGSYTTRLVRLRELTKETEALITELKELEGISSDSKDFHQQINNTAGEILVIKGEIETIRGEIDQLKIDSTSDSTSIKDVLTEAEELLKLNEKTKAEMTTQQEKNLKITETTEALQKEVQKLLGMAVDKKHSHSFAVRKESLVKEKVFWLIGAFSLFISTVMTAIYLLQDKASVDVELAIRLSITFPMFFLSYLLYREYGRIDRKCEAYAFKETIAATVQSYSELLETKYLSGPSFNEEGNRIGQGIDEPVKLKILDFLIRTMDSLYSEPRTNEKLIELEMKAKVADAELELKHSEQSGANKPAN